MPGAVQKTFEFVPAEERINKKDLKFLLEKQKMTLRGIAKPLGVKHYWIWKLAEKYRLKKRRRHVAKFFAKEIVAAKLEGKTAEEIASALGCSRRRILAVIKEYSSEEISAAIGSEAGEVPQEVKPWRCSKHGLVKFRPCVACLAEGNNGAQ